MINGIHIDMITEAHVAVIANLFDWWFNLGATVHVCNNKEQFKTYDESSIEQQVLTGNHNKAKVLGKGTIEVKISPILLVLIGILGVALLETTLTFVHFQVLIGLTRICTLNIAHIVDKIGRAHV